MKCPRCLRPVDHEADSCYSCGYSELEASARFGRNMVALNRIHDAAHCLRKQERDDLNATLDQLELTFPQMLFCVYLGTLPHDLSLSELGFWLLNHGQVRGAEYVRPNENGMLIVMDMTSKQIGLSLGYFAETLIDDESAYRALMHARPNLVNGEYGLAMERIFLFLGRVLRRQGRKLRKLAPGQIPGQVFKRVENVLDIPGHMAPGLPKAQKVPIIKTA